MRTLDEISPTVDYRPAELTDSDISRRKPQPYWKPRPFAGRQFEEMVFQWEASNFSYNPLYFEDPALERYGHTYHEAVQPFVSAARFGVQLVGLPYQMAIDPIHKEIYPLGWYRPGECAPQLLYQIPWNTSAAIAEGAVVTGLIFLIP